LLCFCSCIFFFFQAEDGIRDDLVTGVQTCALPISWGIAPLVTRRRSVVGETWRKRAAACTPRIVGVAGSADFGASGAPPDVATRSEERRVGKEGRSRGARGREKKQSELICARAS